LEQDELLGAFESEKVSARRHGCTCKLRKGRFNQITDRENRQWRDSLAEATFFLHCHETWGTFSPYVT
jgi:hypothetical protein